MTGYLYNSFVYGCDTCKVTHVLYTQGEVGGVKRIHVRPLSPHVLHVDNSLVPLQPFCKVHFHSRLKLGLYNNTYTRGGGFRHAHQTKHETEHAPPDNLFVSRTRAARQKIRVNDHARCSTAWNEVSGLAARAHTRTYTPFTALLFPYKNLAGKLWKSFSSLVKSSPHLFSPSLVSFFAL
jgi:hypothetical protein